MIMQLLQEFRDQSDKNPWSEESKFHLAPVQKHMTFFFFFFFETSVTDSILL